MSRTRLASKRIQAEGLAPLAEASQLDAVLAGNELTWRKLVAEYDPKLREVVRHATQATGQLTEDQIDDVMGDFWLASLADDKRMLRALDSKRSPSLLTWFTFHVAQIAHERARRLAREPECVPLDEMKQVPDLRRAPQPRLRGEAGGATVTGTIDAAIRECVPSTVVSVVRAELALAKRDRDMSEADRPRSAAWWAEQLGCSAESLVKRAKRGTLIATKIGCRFYFTKAQIEGSHRWQRSES